MSDCTDVTGPNITSIYYDSDGDCYDSSGAPIDGVNPDWSSVLTLTLQPKTGEDPCNLEQIGYCGERNPGDNVTIVGNNGTNGVVTVSFDLSAQPGGVVWGWDFGGSTAPSPIKVKVRVRRPSSEQS